MKHVLYWQIVVVVFFYNKNNGVFDKSPLFFLQQKQHIFIWKMFGTLDKSPKCGLEFFPWYFWYEIGFVLNILSVEFAFFL